MNIKHTIVVFVVLVIIGLYIYLPSSIYYNPLSSPTGTTETEPTELYEGRKPPCDYKSEILCDTQRTGAVCCIKFLQICGGIFKDKCEDCCKEEVCRRMTVWPYLMSCRVVESSNCQRNLQNNCVGNCVWTCGNLPLPPNLPQDEPTGTPTGPILPYT